MKIRKRLPQTFFNRPTLIVAKELLGKFLVRRYGKREIAYMITDVEAYDGLHDRGSHASRGKTKRNTPMFGPAGRWYVYFTYGMHWMFNIVTREEGYPGAVLIRGVRGISGPARLTKKLKIDKRFNGLPALPKTGLWIEDQGVKVRPQWMKKGPRVGIAYAGREWAKKPWRLWVDQSFVFGRIRSERSIFLKK